MRIPPDFNISFLTWFRERTNASWSTYQTRPFDDYVAEGVGGSDWQTGTTWTHGLTVEQIEQIERTWRLQFPPDYRLFLEHLHTVDRPLTGAYWPGGKPMAPREEPSFTNWLHPEEVQASFDDLVGGIVFSVQYNGVWLAGWGKRPVGRKAQKQHVEHLVAHAPPLIPLMRRGRFLVSTPTAAGNPVLSIHQADVIVYRANLREYFLHDFWDLLGFSEEPKRDRANFTAALEAVRHVPFWGELITGGTP